MQPPNSNSCGTKQLKAMPDGISSCFMGHSVGVTQLHIYTVLNMQTTFPVGPEARNHFNLWTLPYSWRPKPGLACFDPITCIANGGLAPGCKEQMPLRLGILLRTEEACCCIFGKSNPGIPPISEQLVHLESLRVWRICCAKQWDDKIAQETQTCCLHHYHACTLCRF